MHTEKKTFRTILSQFDAPKMASIIKMNTNLFIKIISGDMKPNATQEKKLIRLARLMEYKYPAKLDYQALSTEFNRPGELRGETFLN